MKDKRYKNLQNQSQPDDSIIFTSFNKEGDLIVYRHNSKSLETFEVKVLEKSKISERVEKVFMQKKIFEKWIKSFRNIEKRIVSIQTELEKNQKISTNY